DVQHRVACVRVEAAGGEQRGADVAGEERVAAVPVRGREALGLDQRVNGEAAGAIEPALVAGAGERLQEREAVARGAVANAVSLLVPVSAGTPDELRAGDQQLFVEVVPGAGDDPGSAGAP